MRIKKLTILFFLLLIPGLVSASVISLTTTITTETMTGDATKIHVKLLNSGDEPAHNVQLSLLLPQGFSTGPVYVGGLVPNKPFETDFDVALTEDILPGNYPIVLLTDYADANSYPFSSLSPSSIVYKTPTHSKVSGLISELTLSGKTSKKLVLTIRNLDDVSHDVEVELFLPRELKVTDSKRTISIGSKEEKQLNFEVSSFSALPGSSYVVLASMEYEDDSHYSSFASGTIEISEKIGLVEFPDWLPIVIVVVLVLIFIYFQFRGRKK